MTRASPRMEQRISGQIGQPAACMIENKRVLQQGNTRCATAAPAVRQRPRVRAVHESCAIMAYPSAASRYELCRPSSGPSRPHPGSTGSRSGDFCLAFGGVALARRSHTDSVDNFVGKPVTGLAKPRKYLACVKTMTKEAVKNQMKSKACTTDSRSARCASGVLRIACKVRAVWSSRQPQARTACKWRKVLRGLAGHGGCAERTSTDV